MRHLLFALALIAVAVATVRAGSEPAFSKTGTVVLAAPMLEPRADHSATLLPNGKVLLAGGMRRNQDFYRSAELYDPATGRFQATGAMNVARVGSAAVLLRSGKALIVGGWTAGHGPTDSAELYDPQTGKFTPVGNMTTPRGQPTATLLANGDVLIAGGGVHGSPGGIAAAEIFHPDTQKFEAVAPMHYARVAHTATLLTDGHVLIAGGRGDSVTATAELYDPARKQFVMTGSLQMARYKHTAGLLPDGRVLIAGGSDERDWHGLMNSAEIYDPHSGRFSSAASLSNSRFKLPEVAAQVGSGQLLIAGGSKQVEVYDSRAGKFLVASGQLSDTWHFMTETPLKDGSVLLAGGYPNNDQATAQAWIYRP